MSFYEITINTTGQHIILLYRDDNYVVRQREADKQIRLGGRHTRYQIYIFTYVQYLDISKTRIKANRSADEVMNTRTASQNAMFFINPSTPQHKRYAV